MTESWIRVRVRMDIPFDDAANVWIATGVTPLMNDWKNSRLRCKKRTGFANRLSETRSVRVLSKLVVRPVGTEDIESCLSEIESDIYANFEGDIHSDDIEEAVMKHWKPGSGQVRFASVYREFKDVRDFVNELQPILQRDQSQDADADSLARSFCSDRFCHRIFPPA